MDERERERTSFVKSRVNMAELTQKMLMFHFSRFSQQAR